MEMKKLTIRQKMVLEYIEWFIKENGFSPTIQEIQKAMGFKYYYSAFSILSYLEEKGYISTAYGKARTIKLLGGDNNEKCG